MSNAAALTVPHLVPANTNEGASRALVRVEGSRPPPVPADRPSHTASRSSFRPRFLFGDSTPFPHDVDFVDTIDHAVTCGVALMKAHHAIARATSRIGAADRMRREDRAALLGIADAVKRAVSSETTGASEIAQRTAGRALAVTRAVVETELATIEADAQRQVAGASAALEDARTATTQAIEELAKAHDLPGTEIALRLVLRDGSYDAIALVLTPYGVEAGFSLAIPGSHPWAETRRVADLEDGIEVRLPRDAGWFSKRVELRTVKLGKLYVREVAVDPGRCALVLSKSAKGPGGFRFELDPRSGMRVTWTEIPEVEDAQPGTPYELSVDDAASVLRLWRTVERSTRDLGTRRVHMKRATFDGKPLTSQDPLAVCDRLVRALAPTTREIARRAGAPGELVLRRDAGSRRRDEIYVTKAELMERIETLPPPLRRVFDPLDLEGAPRSPRAPAPSLPAFIEVEEADILHEG